MEEEVNNEYDQVEKARADSFSDEEHDPLKEMKEEEVDYFFDDIQHL